MDKIDLGSISNMGQSSPVEPTQRKVSKEAASPASQADEVKISSEGVYVSSLVEDVKKMSPIRPEVVEEMRAKVKGGNYPPPELVDGLVRLMGSIDEQVESE